jgi:hypothetical protein
MAQLAQCQTRHQLDTTSITETAIGALCPILNPTLISG